MLTDSLTEKQLAVIDDLFDGSLDDDAIIQKHGITADVFYDWLCDDLFKYQLDAKIRHSRTHAEMILAKYAPFAAARLIALTDSEKEETARKACLDIISFFTSIKKTDDTGENPDEQDDMKLAPGVAEKIWAILADENPDTSKNDLPKEIQNGS
jgi:hypothetical protein